MKIDDLINVFVNGCTRTVHIAGLQRDFGTNSAITSVKFYCDSKEYWFPVEQVKLAKGTPTADDANFTEELVHLTNLIDKLTKMSSYSTVKR